MRYELHRVIGRGGMATVWRATDHAAEQQVAVKVLHGHLAGDEGIVEAFEREAALMGRIDHPGIVQVFTTAEIDGLPAVVMELCDGGDLAGRLARQGAFGEREALEVMVPVLQALEEVHRQGIVHRDVKPGNVVFDSEGNPKLIDFGIGQAEELMEAEEAGQLGTVEYMAPERTEGFAVDARSDIYSAGVVLFELLCGHVPYRAGSAAEVLRMHRRADVPDVELFVDDVSERTRSVVRRAMAKRVEQRFDDAGQMLAVLQGDRQLHQPVPDHRRWAELVEAVDAECEMVAPVETEEYEWVVVTADVTGEHHVDMDRQVEAINTVAEDYSQYSTGSSLAERPGDQLFRRLIRGSNLFSRWKMADLLAKSQGETMDLVALSEREVAAGLSQTGAERIVDEIEERGGDVRLMRRPRSPDEGTRGTSAWIVRLASAVGAAVLATVAMLLFFGAAAGSGADPFDPSTLIPVFGIWLFAGVLLGVFWDRRAEMFGFRTRPMLDFYQSPQADEHALVGTEHVELHRQIGSPQIAASYRRTLNMALHLGEPSTPGVSARDHSVQPVVEQVTELARRIVELEQRLAATPPVQLAARTRRLDRQIEREDDVETIERLMDEKAQLRSQLEQRDALRQRLEMMAQRMLDAAGRLERMVRRRQDDDATGVVLDFDDEIAEMVEEVEQVGVEVEAR